MVKWSVDFETEEEKELVVSALRMLARGSLKPERLGAYMLTKAVVGYIKLDKERMVKPERLLKAPRHYVVIAPTLWGKTCYAATVAKKALDEGWIVFVIDRNVEYGRPGDIVVSLASDRSLPPEFLGEQYRMMMAMQFMEALKASAQSVAQLALSASPGTMVVVRPMFSDPNLESYAVSHLMMTVLAQRTPNHTPMLMIVEEAWLYQQGAAAVVNRGRHCKTYAILLSQQPLDPRVMVQCEMHWGGHWSHDILREYGIGADGIVMLASAAAKRGHFAVRDYSSGEWFWTSGDPKEAKQILKAAPPTKSFSF